MTYLELVNEVLTRLREDVVTTVTQSDYSTLIGHYVNDAKRAVEDAYPWSALDASVGLTTSAGVYQYTLTGSGLRPKYVTVNVTTSGQQTRVANRPPQWIQDQNQLTTVQSSRPCYYAWSGSDGTDRKVELHPTPDGTYSLSFNMNVPQAKLTNDADELLVPYEPVVAYAYALAKLERGEDGSLTSSESYQLYKNVLSDYIAVEQSLDETNDSWEAT